MKNCRGIYDAVIKFKKHWFLKPRKKNEYLHACFHFILINFTTRKRITLRIKILNFKNNHRTVQKYFNAVFLKIYKSAG